MVTIPDAIVHTVQVFQLSQGGWEVHWLRYGYVRRYKTAINTLRGIKREDKKISADGHYSVITNVNWSYLDDVGRTIVQEIVKENMK